MLPDIIQFLATLRARTEQEFERFCMSHRRAKKLSRELEQSILDFRLQFWNEDKYFPDYREEWHQVQATKTLKLKHAKNGNRQ